MRTKYDWPALIAAQAESGLTQVAFCAARGIHPMSFGRARRRLRRQAPGRGLAVAEPFVRVVPSTPTRMAPLELAFGDLTLRFAEHTAPAVVAALVVALR